MQIHLPQRLNLTTFDGVYDRLHRLSQTEPLQLHMDGLRFAEPAGLLPLACFLRNHVLAGGNLAIQSFPTDVNVCGYLERVNFYALVRHPCPHQPGRRTNNDSFIEITELGAHTLPEPIKAKLYSLFDGRVDVKNAVGESFLTACGELVDNTRHAYNVAIEPQAAAWPPAMILGQYYESPNSLHVTVADCGIGVLRSLEAKDPQDAYKSEKRAIDRALILGMKGFNRSGKGLGLAAIGRFMRRNRGRFSIRSGVCLSIQTNRRVHRKVDSWK
jgi:hypothetical protein